MAIISALEYARDVSATVAPYAILASLAFVIYKVIYQLYFHPLAKFPGPKLAALTGLYEDYYQWSHEGTFPLVLDRLHTKYGDYVRIGPDEVHIADADCYDSIFNFSPEIDKVNGQGSREPTGHGLFGQTAVEDSKFQRRPYNPPFSRPAVVKKEKLIRNKIEAIVDVLDKASGTEEVVDIASYYRALTTDVIASFAFGTDMDLLHNLDRGERLYSIWRAQWKRMARFNSTGLRFVLLPWVEKVFEMLPSWIVSKDTQSIRSWVEYQQEMHTYVFDTLDAIKKMPKGTEASEASGQLPAFQEALRSRHTVPAHLETSHLFANGNVVFLAGSETTASAMGAGAYHLLANPDILHDLQADLDKAWANGPPSWTDLEHIPLLKGVVMETLRLDNGVARRFTRVNWQADTSLNGKAVIPRGYMMSMSHRFMFWNPEIFPNPQKFDPYRWTQSDEQTHLLSKYVHPFSKGTRQCLAYSIAQAELYMAFADIHHRFDLELVDTTRENIDCTVDRILSFPKAGKMTVKVKVKGRRV